MRIACLDAVEVMDRLLPAGMVSELWVFFPDPWHKSKHKKRRLIQPVFAERAARVLAPTGVWRLATDWSDYAAQMREVIGSSSMFRNPHLGQRAGEHSPLTQVRLGDLDAVSLGKEAHPKTWNEAVDTEGGWAPRYAARVVTDFEQKALDAGRMIFDLSFIRTTK